MPVRFQLVLDWFAIHPSICSYLCDCSLSCQPTLQTLLSYPPVCLSSHVSLPYWFIEHDTFFKTSGTSRNPGKSNTRVFLQTRGTRVFLKVFSNRLWQHNSIAILSGWWFQTLLKNISLLGWLFPIYGELENVLNHQPLCFKVFQYVAKGFINLFFLKSPQQQWTTQCLSPGPHFVKTV